MPKTECLVLKKFDSQLIAIVDNYTYILEEFERHRKDLIFEIPVKKEKKSIDHHLNTPLKNKVMITILKIIDHINKIIILMFISY